MKVGTRREALRLLAASGCLLAGGCGTRPPGPPVEAAGPIRYVLEDVARPDLFSRTGRAERDPSGAVGGAWAVVPGLPRPERGLVRHLVTGAETTTALFAAPGGAANGPIVLSASVAAALGVPAGGAAPVLVVALREQPRLLAPAPNF
jgi:hypothetical protein